MMSCAKALMSDFEKSFLDPQFSDFVLLCQGEEVQVHKFVLSSRSPVFAAMFQSQMSENVKGEMTIDDVEKDVLKELLRYMYSAKVDASFAKFQELLIVADKYQVEELIKYCGLKLAESLNKDNAFQIGSFAELHNAEALMKTCVRYILNNQHDNLHKNWKDLVKGSPKMIEMIQYLLDDN